MPHFRDGQNHSPKATKVPHYRADFICIFAPNLNNALKVDAGDREDEIRFAVSSIRALFK
jgi:hypothetical protein